MFKACRLRETELLYQALKNMSFQVQSEQLGTKMILKQHLLRNGTNYGCNGLANIGSAIVPMNSFAWFKLINLSPETLGLKPHDSMIKTNATGPVGAFKAL